MTEEGPPTVYLDRELIAAGDVVSGVKTQPFSPDLITNGHAIRKRLIAFPGVLKEAYSYLELVLDNMSSNTEKTDFWIIYGIDKDFQISGELNCSRVLLGKITDHVNEPHNGTDKPYMKLTASDFTNGRSQPGSIVVKIRPPSAGGYVSAQWNGVLTTMSTSVYTVSGYGYCALRDVNGFMICGTTDFKTFPLITADYTLYGYPKVTP